MMELIDKSALMKKVEYQYRNWGEDFRKMQRKGILMKLVTWKE